MNEIVPTLNGKEVTTQELVNHCNGLKDGFNTLLLWVGVETLIIMGLVIYIDRTRKR